jgi:hypothetical protein
MTTRIPVPVILVLETLAVRSPVAGEMVVEIDDGQTVRLDDTGGERVELPWHLGLLFAVDSLAIAVDQVEEPGAVPIRNLGHAPYDVIGRDTDVAELLSSRSHIDVGGIDSPRPPSSSSRSIATLPRS